MGLKNAIFSINSDEEFEEVALQVFKYQFENCAVYREYVQSLGVEEPMRLQEIPFLPISFFKSHKILSTSSSDISEFKSSGTGGNRSTHFVSDLAIYERSFNQTYNELIGRPENQVILALLPNYIEQGDSSLVYMVNHLIERSENELSGFVLNDLEKIQKSYKKGIEQGKSIVIFGVSYALLDLAEGNVNLSQATIIETGGMKGRRKEMTKEQLHRTLIKGLNVEYIASEYGMTELLSQGYSNKNGVFQCASTMRVLIREINDPFSYIINGKTGGINIIDLANINSCSFIETQDLGQLNSKGFRLMGRFDNSDIRGCNLLVE